jgi:hypothetical protein
MKTRQKNVVSAHQERKRDLWRGYAIFGILCAVHRAVRMTHVVETTLARAQQDTSSNRRMEMVFTLP